MDGAIFAEGNMDGEDFTSDEELRRRYLQLRQQFDRVSAAGLRTQREVSELHALAVWALRVGPSGWALVRGGAVKLTNRAFDVLDRGSVIGPRWQALQPGGFVPVDPEGAGRSLLETVADEARALLAEGGTTRILRLARADRVVELTAERPAMAADKELVIATARDVTEHARAEANLSTMQARVVERERTGLAGEMAVGLAHDLGNLVGALTAEMMVLESQPEALPQVLGAMREILDGQLALVSKLKSVARPAPDRPEQLGWLEDLVRPAARVVQSWLGLGDRKRPVWIRVEADTLAKLPPVLGLREELVNVLINLLLNARDAMTEGGLIRITGVPSDAASADAQLSAIAVEDQGPGIPPDKLEKIFEPFYSTKGARGTGMGLAMARQVLRRLGGDVIASNRREGGARFEVQLRAHEHGSPPDAEDGGGAPGPAVAEVG